MTDWGSVANEYEKESEPITGHFLSHFMDILKPHRSFRVTDVGCGPGVVSMAMAKAGAQVTSVDLAPAMIERLTARAAEEGVSDKITALVADAQDLPLPLRHGHAAVSSFGIIFCPDVDKALMEMARVTTGGGKLVITAWTTEDRNGWTALLPEGWQQRLGFELGPRPAYKWATALDLHIACEKANWNDVDVQLYEGLPSVYGSWRDVTQALETPPSRQTISSLTTEQVDALKRLLEEEAKARFGDGEVTLAREAWVARGYA